VTGSPGQRRDNKAGTPGQLSRDRPAEETPPQGEEETRGKAGGPSYGPRPPRGRGKGEECREGKPDD